MSAALSAKTRKRLVGLIALGNLVAWIPRSNVLELVAREQHVLCGRYSQKHFLWLLGAGILSLIVVYVITGQTADNRRRRCFRVAACGVGLAPALLAVDVFLRLRTDYPYQMDDVVYHRPPHAVYRLTYEDEPEMARSYPRRPQGYGRVDCVLTYDANGYRNAGVPSSCEIVTVGDSFTEGSRVSDDQSWPEVLAKISGHSVYNLGISGYSPPEYLAAVKQYGLPLKPRFVVCMLYEGNDFRSSDITVKRGVSLKQIVKTSPLLLRANDALVVFFGSLRANADFDGQDDLSWMPLAYPSGEASRHYAFAPKQLIELNVPAETFSSSAEWFAAKGVLRELQETCRAAGAELVIVYAPNKAHVVFPPVAAELPGEPVRAFLALRSKQPLPPANELIAQLLRHLDQRESVVARWCAERGIRFISLTQALRREAGRGRQTYYTFDQHWTPIGHETAARTIHEAMSMP